MSANAASPSLSKIPFKVMYATSCADSYSERDLENPSPHTRGWQSARFAEFPQELVMEFQQPCRVRKIQLLSHHCKIASKVEISFSNEKNFDLDTKFTVFGFTSFQTNEKTGFQSRELKSVQTDFTARFVKLSLRGCHVNPHNLYNQVGLVALTILQEATATSEKQALDLLMDVQLDQKSAQRIREVMVNKAKAVEDENYEAAKYFTWLIDLLKRVGVQVAALEKQKIAAVAAEDFDAAQRIKAHIDSIRASVPQSNDLPPPIPSEVPANNVPLPASQQPAPIQPPVVQQPIAMERPISRHSHKKSEGEAKRLVSVPEHPVPAAAPEPVNSLKSTTMNSMSERSQTLRQIVLDVDNDRNETVFNELLVPVFSEQVAQSFYADKSEIRSLAFKAIQEPLLHGGFSHTTPDSLIAALFYIIDLGLQDSAIDVFVDATSVLRIMLRVFGAGLDENVRMEMIPWIEFLSARSGEAEELVRASCQQSLLSFAKIQHIFPEEVVRFAVAPCDPSLQGHLIAKLELLTMVLRCGRFQNGGWAYPVIIEFVWPLLESPDEHVRHAALTLGGEALLVGGPSLFDPFVKSLPKEAREAKLSLLQKSANDEIPKEFMLHLGDEAANPVFNGVPNQQQEYFPVRQSNGVTDSIDGAASTDEVFGRGYCQFCGLEDPSLTGKQLEFHLEHQCPLLTSCPQCGQVLEVPILNEHLLQCEVEKNQLCARCHEPIPLKQVEAHLKAANCEPAINPQEGNRCPLCHHNIGAGAEGWKQHLIEHGCAANPRTRGAPVH